MEQISLFNSCDAFSKTLQEKDSRNIHYCLWNGEYGEHDLSHISGLDYVLKNQENVYKNYIGIIIGDFTCVAVEYDFGKRDQRWKVRCNLCGEETYRYHTSDWRRGKGGKTICHCRKDAERKHVDDRKRDRDMSIERETGKVYGKFKVIEYKGYDACKVVCMECGAVRRTGVTISKLQQGIYPKCDCGKPNYADEKWIGARVGHLVVEGYGDGKFFCRCDCGMERVVVCTNFSRKRYHDCGEPNCKFMGESREKAISARIRGNTYEALALGIIKSGGYKAKITGKVGDFGVDIIATDADGMKIAVQCKSNMKSLTGVEAIQQVYAGGRYYGLEHFAVISHSGYSVNAVKMAKKLGVYLSDGKSFMYPDDMKKYINELVPTYNATKNTKAQKLYELNGEKKTLANWAFEYGTNEEKVRNGLKRGLSLENALKYTSRRKEYTYQGFTGTISDIYRQFSPCVSLQAVRERLKRGKSIEEALFNQPVISGRPKKNVTSDRQTLFEF